MTNVWINEFHYDNGGTADLNEFIEIAGRAGTDLSGWKIQLYNGSTNGLYASSPEVPLSGIISDATGNGFGFISVNVPGLQNGDPDGFALIDADGNVVEFLSYEGTITAINGAAVGMTSTNIGALENGAGSATGSIQRQGTGSDSTGFNSWVTFSADGTATRDGANTGQTFISPLPTLSITATSADKPEGNEGTTTEFMFTVTRSSLTGSPTADWTLNPGQASLDDFDGPLSGKVAFAEGETTATITIRVKADAEFEPDETFSLTLSNPDGATIPVGSETASGQIDNDDVTTDEVLSISAADAAQEEGDGPGSTIYTFTVTRENGDGTTEVNWSIEGFGQNGLTAEDFARTTGTVTFAEGQTEAVIQVQVAGNTRFEGDEPFTVRISTEKTGVQIQNATANGTIENDDLQQSFSIAATDAVKVEGDTGETVFTFTVTRANSTGEAATVDWDLDKIGGTGQASTDDFFTTGGTVTFAEGETTATVQIRVRGDLTKELAQTFSVRLSDPSEGVIGTAAADGRILPDDFDRIYEIQTQDANRESVLKGQTVTTTGIITGIQMTGTTRGFYIQDATGDGDAATSDGIFVFMGSNWTPSFEVGDEVVVNGRVDENFGLTRIDGGTSTRAATVGLIDKGNALPEAIVIGPNGIEPPTDTVAKAIDFYEALEGMRVSVEPTRVVGATSDFGEIYTLIEGAYDPSSLNDRGGLSTSPTDFNPERIQFDNIRDSLNMPMVDVGARLGAITGIMSYGFSNYEVLIGTTPVVTQASNLQPEVTSVTRPNEFFLTFGNYNVENLDINDDDGDADVDGGQFAAIANQIVNNLGGPAVLALQEIQDDSGSVDNGVTSSDKTLQKLVDFIVAAGGPRYKFAYLEPENNKDGGQGGGNIRQAFLYNDDVVDLVEGSLKRITDPDPQVNDAFEASRKPLVAQFDFQGERYTFINNHLNSKGGDTGIFGTTQPPVLGSEAQRIEQTKLINAYVDALLAADANANIAVLGDLNDFSWSNPLKVLDGTFGGGEQVLWNIADEFITDPRNRTDYIYEGNSQSLDHIYVSAAMRARMEAFDIVRVNSEFDADQQVSDHDALVARSTFQITRAAAGNSIVVGTEGSNALLGSAGDNVLSGGAGRDYLQGDAGNDILLGGLGADGLFGGEGIDWASYDGAVTGVRASLAAPGGNTGEAAGDTYNSIENLLGSRAADALFGNAGANVIDGSLGADAMDGGAGDDIFYVDNAGDNVIGGIGNDTVLTSVSFTLGSDVENLIANGTAALELTGNSLANTITGNAGSNKVAGELGNDVIETSSGNDQLDGGLGNDLLYGGSGKDVFVFDTRLNKSTNVDRVYDFRSQDDSFYLDNAVFTKLGRGSTAGVKFKSDMFVNATKAQDREDRIVYDKKTGALYYDQDGTGSKAQVKIATIVNKATLKHDDFFVI